MTKMHLCEMNNTFYGNISFSLDYFITQKARTTNSYRNDCALRRDTRSMDEMNKTWSDRERERRRLKMRDQRVFLRPRPTFVCMRAYFCLTFSV